MQVQARVDPDRFNSETPLPYSLRLSDFQIAMEDVYDFFFDVNSFFISRSLPRLDDLLRPANMSGLISDMLTASIANMARKPPRDNVRSAKSNGSAVAKPAQSLIQRGLAANETQMMGATPRSAMAK